jgi:hypothetical protein
MMNCMFLFFFSLSCRHAAHEFGFSDVSYGILQAARLTFLASLLADWISYSFSCKQLLLLLLLIS